MNLACFVGRSDFVSHILGGDVLVLRGWGYRPTINCWIQSSRGLRWWTL